MPLGGADLLFNQIEVVEQPFRRRGHPAIGGDGRGQQPAHVDQSALVGCQASQKVVRTMPVRQLVRRSKSLAMLFHLVGAEQLRSQRGLLVARGTCPLAAAKPRLQLLQVAG